jgi:uncharacterized protein
VTDGPDRDDLDDDLDDDEDFDTEDYDDEDDFDDDPNRVRAATATSVLDYLVKAIVEDPDAVELDVDDGRRGVSLRVSVAPDDMGRVIGKRGRIANSIRTVVRAAAVRDDVDVDVDFVD